MTNPHRFGLPASRAVVKGETQRCATDAAAVWMDFRILGLFSLTTRLCMAPPPFCVGYRVHENRHAFGHERLSIIDPVSGVSTLTLVASVCVFRGSARS